jgi:hypothetical protein
MVGLLNEEFGIQSSDCRRTRDSHSALFILTLH